MLRRSSVSPAAGLSTEQWLAAGVVAALLALPGLAIAVLALAREVGMLRLRLGASSALEIAEEGPELGERVEVIERFDDIGERALALAVFTSEGCRVCRGLEPAIASLADHPALAVRGLRRGGGRGGLAALAIPGSPFAVAMDPGGTVLAKGTFNNLAQLESVLATAETRRAELVGGG